METTLRQSLILLAACAALAGCSAPTVNLATSEPIKVDINMRLDVYQYNTGGTNATKPVIKAGSDQTIEARRRNRSADIQTFKNSQLVGEGRDGLLAVRPKIEKETPDYREYIRVTIDAENADRMEVMKAAAETQKASLPDVQAKQAGIWRNSAFPGEVIEVPDPEGKGWVWVPKGG